MAYPDRQDIDISIARALLALTEYQVAVSELRAFSRNAVASSRDRILESKILLGSLARHMAPLARLPSPRD